ncbi:chymotrypsin-like elastase family member 1 [Anopheles ziemanni]|uniref:chymotrypsin-like elastase family member 1 n=1 Tax=Anopheles coustani TaxID=139045 RepID=UPI0026582EDF|nr:chymotrypsin-like elastase family member 1 [Anopheles coustani]XP_058170151.1 chymotrypsin-like elastase family member 1 [Anopheles ziemanni]
MSLFVCVLFIPQAISIWDCGTRDINFEHLIYYGKGAKAGQWPWHVAIYHGERNNYEYKCGGSIIDSNTILTSAHCICSPNGLHSTSRIRVHLGRVMLNETNNHTQEHAVSKLIPHPNFHPGIVSYDIALIKLSTRINFTAYVQPICLWGMDAGMELIVGTNGTIVGFGETENSKLSNHLRVALVKVTDFWSCLDSYRNVFADGMFCAKGNGEVNACRGDSGGGIVYEIAGRWFVRGIVSFIPQNSILSCDVSQYTVFTDVAIFREWIAKYVDPAIMATQEEYLIENSPNKRIFWITKPLSAAKRSS